MDFVLDVLWPVTREAFDLPEKPLFATSCNRCGLCCLYESCALSQLLFGNKGVCPALKLEAGQSHCQLITNPAAVLPEIIAEDARAAASIMLGSGMGCDSQFTPEDNAAADAKPDWPPRAVPAESAKVAQLLRGMSTKLVTAAAEAGGFPA